MLKILWQLQQQKWHNIHNGEDMGWLEILNKIV